MFALVPRNGDRWKSWLFDDRRNPDGTGSDGIYPTFLKVGQEVVKQPLTLDTDSVGLSVPFLDLRIILTHFRTDNVWRFMWDLYDKRNELDVFCGMRKFPHAETVLPGDTKGRVILTEVGRFDRRTSYETDLRRHVQTLGLSYLDHGYSAEVVRKQVAGYRRDQKGTWKTTRTLVQRFVDKTVADRKSSTTVPPATSNGVSI